MLVDANLRVPGRQDVFVIGDCATLAGADGKPLPGAIEETVRNLKTIERLLAALPDSQPQPA